MSKKGEAKRKWSKEKKLEIVYKHLNEHTSIKALGKEYDADHSMIGKWVKKFIEEGEEGFDPKPRKGNVYAALHSSKSLSENERLKLIIAKQEIEIERLKKGYQVKGAGAKKEYVTTNDVNMKSLTGSKKNTK